MRVYNIVLIILVILTQLVSAQDIPIFEVADNEALGLTPVLVDRWGCTVADIDRNGYPDIFNAKWRGRLESQIYMNQDGFFTDIYGNSPELSAVEKEGNATRTPVFVDYDNDGDRDLMIGFDKSHHFFRNDDGVFVKITDQIGLINEVPGFVSTYSYEMSAWIDIDLDGDPDGVMFQTNNKSFLVYRNDGDAFTDIAEEVGLADVLPLGSAGDWGYYTGRLQWVDFDNDGDPDLNAGYLMFRNDDGMFTEVAESIGFMPSTDLWFTNWLDFDVDGDMDFIGQKGSSAELWRNDNGIFAEATQDVGLDLFNKPNQTSLNVGDLDNDGDEDVFIQINDWTGDDIEALLLNDESEGVRSFVDVAAYTGMTVQGDRKGSAILDYDMDGLLDVFIPSLQYGSILYHNLGPETPNNWIGFDLWGTQSNKDALGSWVTLYAGGKKQVRYTKAGQTWKLQDKPYVHFGIGQATRVDSVVIRWSLGNKQVLINPAINQYHKIEETSGTNVLLADIQEPKKLILAQNYPNPFNPTTTIHYSLAKTEDVTLKIFNIRGEEISTLLAGENKPAGQHSIMWNGKDDHGSKVSSGIYIYQLQAGEVIVTKKMSLIE